MSCCSSCAADAIAREVGGRGSCQSSVRCPSTCLPACSLDTLEHTVHASKDTTSLECLAWAVYDNLLGPRKSLSLSGYESYGQVVQCLVDNAYRGLHSHCPVCTLSIIQLQEEDWSLWLLVPWKSPQAREFPMMRDIWEEFAKEDQVTRGHGWTLRSMPLSGWRSRQCSYTDEQLNFWLLLWPLTDSSRGVQPAPCMQWLLSVWHWVSALDPPTYPPSMPSSLNIGHWLCKDCKVSETQKWIEAYACTLQHVGKASVGHSWT